MEGVRVLRRWVRPVLVVAMLVLAACHSNGGADAKGVSTTTVPAKATVTSEATATSAPTVSTSGPVPSSSAAGRILTGAGTTLTRPLQTTVRGYNPRAGCNLLVDPGWTGTVNCGQIASHQATAVWVAENRQPDAWGETRLLLWTISNKGSQASLRLRAAILGDSMVNGATVDFGDGDQKVLFSTATVGMSGHRVFDLVEPDGTVVVHRDLAYAAARIGTSMIETWGEDTVANQAAFTHDVIRYVDGAWRIVSSEPSTQEAEPRNTI
jgi:hypothetical protein